MLNLRSDFTVCQTNLSCAKQEHSNMHYGPGFCVVKHNLPGYPSKNTATWFGRTYGVFAWWRLTWNAKRQHRKIIPGHSICFTAFLLGIGAWCWCVFGRILHLPRSRTRSIFLFRLICHHHCSRYVSKRTTSITLCHNPHPEAGCLLTWSQKRPFVNQGKFWQDYSCDKSKGCNFFL